VKITVERCDKFFVAVPQIFDRVKSVALWSAKKKKRTIKGYGSAATLNNALDRQKATLIEHFENSLVKNEKAAGVDTAEFSFKREGNKIQYSFNLKHLEKLSRIENNIKLNKLNAVYDIITEEQTILRKRNTILKIADHHGWDTVKDYLDSPLADDKEDASDLRAAISRANRKRSTPKPYN